MKPATGQLRMGPSKEQQKQVLSRKWIDVQWVLLWSQGGVVDPRVVGRFCCCVRSRSESMHTRPQCRCRRIGIAIASSSNFAFFLE